jgi:hypothetical protein
MGGEAQEMMGEWGNPRSSVFRFLSSFTLSDTIDDSLTRQVGLLESSFVNTLAHVITMGGWGQKTKTPPAEPAA